MGGTARAAVRANDGPSMLRRGGKTIRHVPAEVPKIGNNRRGDLDSARQYRLCCVMALCPVQYVADVALM
jgi:hypothetical protein